MTISGEGEVPAASPLEGVWKDSSLWTPPEGSASSDSEITKKYSHIYSLEQLLLLLSKYFSSYSILG